MQLPIDPLIKELRSSPYTMITILLLAAFASWAWANYVTADEVDRRIQAVETKVDTVYTRAKRIETKLDTSIALALASDIRSHRQLLCAASGPDREHLQRTIDTIQEAYYDIKNQYYPVSRCGS